MREDLDYLRLLSNRYPDIMSASSEIINLMAICSLPKGTEYFFSDLHGEYEAFIHLLRSASGTIREKIRETFGYIIPEEEQLELANLIYYPEKVLQKMTQDGRDTRDWQKVTINRLVSICKVVASKYTRHKVDSKTPDEYTHVINELLYVDHDNEDKQLYYDEIIRAITDTGSGDNFIIVLSELIQSLAIDQLHIIGDVFDRGPRADIILNKLMEYQDIDIQWGNHDVDWMGAAAGNPACVCNVLRVAISYNCFDVLEDGYGINLRPLSMFASKIYADDPCEIFRPKILDENIYDAVDPVLTAKMHKAVAILQFKVEGQIIKRHPEYGMDDRILLEHVDYDKGTVTVEGKEYEMLDMSFPTVDPKDPLKLTKEEEDLLRTLVLSFRHSDLLQKHIRFMYSKGSMYKCCNGNLLYHGCIPMDDKGNFQSLQIEGQDYAGKALMDKINEVAYKAFFLPEHDPQKQNSRDLMWYLWCGAKSPVFGKAKITTFEHYFIADKSTQKEKMNAYYQLSVKEEICNKILSEFGLPEKGSHIINGHVPVKIKEGESPIKANGKLYVIDGGLSKAYQKTTGIAGYTLIYNSHHLALAEHKPFHPDKENTPNVTVTEKMPHRILIGNTDEGAELKQRITDLAALVNAYRSGALKEHKGE